jgi:hypothetical protein
MSDENSVFVGRTIDQGLIKIMDMKLDNRVFLTDSEALHVRDRLTELLGDKPEVPATPPAPIGEKPIDWEQRRWAAAVAFMAERINVDSSKTYHDDAVVAVSIVDTLESAYRERYTPEAACAAREAREANAAARIKSERAGGEEGGEA